jgi:hypothetical protein
MYVFGLVIAKLQALLFLWDNSWGTSPRLSRSTNQVQKILPLVWALLVTSGLGYRIYRFFYDEELVTVDILVYLSLFGGFLTIQIVFFVIRRQWYKHYEQSNLEKGYIV